MPSPQTIVEWQFAPMSSHTQFGSSLHDPEQQSPGSVFPSSHTSSSWLSIPSPHAGTVCVMHPSGSPTSAQGSTAPPSIMMMGGLEPPVPLPGKLPELPPVSDPLIWSPGPRSRLGVLPAAPHPVSPRATASGTNISEGIHALRISCLVHYR